MRKTKHLERNSDPVRTVCALECTPARGDTTGHGTRTKGDLRHTAPLVCEARTSTSGQASGASRNNRSRPTAFALWRRLPRQRRLIRGGGSSGVWTNGGQASQAVFLPAAVASNVLVRQSRIDGQRAQGSDDRVELFDEPLALAGWQGGQHHGVNLERRRLDAAQRAPALLG